MTDEKLIAQLRAWDGTPFDEDAKAAADRIEQLVKERDLLQEAADEAKRLWAESETALAAERAKTAKLVEAGKALGLREIVAGWNGEGKEKPYIPHPAHLWATIKTTCGAVYALDAAITEASQ